MKKERRSLIPVVTVVCLLSVSAFAQYSGGSGTAEDPYQIATAADLMLLGETSEDYDKHFVLTADIDLNPNLSGGKVFDRAVIAPEPDWHGGTSFTGVFDGNAHTISHLTIDGEGYLGLFGQLGLEWQDARLGEVKNLGLVDVDISGAGDDVAALVGHNWSGSIASSYSSGTVSGVFGNVGGLVGYNENGSIATSYSSAAVIGLLWVGGLVGYNNNGSIATSYSIGGVSGGQQVGGLVGYNTGRIARSYSGGTVYGVGAAGGLVGVNGQAPGSRDQPGHRGYIIESYSTGSVSGDSIVGGLLGENLGDVLACFWDIETSGEPNMCGRVYTACDPNYGKRTAEMKQQSTFTDWDFIDVWGIGEGQTYPYLRTTLAGDINEDGIVNFLDLCIIAGQWMEGEPPERGVEVTDVRIIRGEMDGGVFQAIEEVEEVAVGDIFVIKVDVKNFGAEAEDMFNIYGWELSPEGAVEVIGDGFMACLAFYALEPGESATLIPFCGNRAFEAKQAESVTMSIDIGNGVCAGTFEFGIVP